MPAIVMVLETLIIIISVILGSISAFMIGNGVSLKLFLWWVVLIILLCFLILGKNVYVGGSSKEMNHYEKTLRSADNTDQILEIVKKINKK